MNLKCSNVLKNGNEFKNQFYVIVLFLFCALLIYCIKTHRPEFEDFDEPLNVFRFTLGRS